MKTNLSALFQKEKDSPDSQVILDPKIYAKHSAFQGDAIKRIIAFLLKHPTISCHFDVLTKGERTVLDLGYGNGTTLLVFLLMLIDNVELSIEHIYGLDISPGMNTITEKRFTQHEKTKTIPTSFFTNSIQALAQQFNPHTKFDLVSSFFMFHYLAPDAQRDFLKQLEPKMKKDGLGIFVIPTASPNMHYIHSEAIKKTNLIEHFENTRFYGDKTYYQDLFIGADFDVLYLEKHVESRRFLHAEAFADFVLSWSPYAATLRKRATSSEDLKLFRTNLITTFAAECPNYKIDFHQFAVLFKPRQTVTLRSKL